MKPTKQSQELTLERKEVFDFLETLRESGIVNMFGAAPYITAVFRCSREEARHWHLEWIKTYHAK